MEIKVNYLDNLRQEARFDDFTVIADQPIPYKRRWFSARTIRLFLASSALCAAYFVKSVLCARDIPTDNIRLSQNNIVDPETATNRFLKFRSNCLPTFLKKDRQGILRSIDRCTVKKVIQTGPEFIIEEVENIDADAQALLMPSLASKAAPIFRAKDLPLEQTICQYVQHFGWLGHED